MPIILGCGFCRSCAWGKKKKDFLEVSNALLSAHAYSAWLLQESVWVFAFLVTLQQMHAVISVLTAFAPHSADSCISPKLRGVNASTCHHLLLLPSRKMALCRGWGEPCHSHRVLLIRKK